MLSVITRVSSRLAAIRRDRAGRQHAVGHIRHHRGRPGVQQRLRRIAQRAARIDDVVDQNAQAPGDVADHVDDFGHPGAFAALIDDRQLSVKPLGDAARAPDAADVRRHDDRDRAGS